MSKEKRKRLERVGFCLWGALAIVLLQIAVCLYLSGRPFPGSMVTLTRWDGGWYRNIVVNGYQSTIPPFSSQENSNVAFFPGFPMTARWVMKTFSISANSAMLLVAHAFAVVFWTFLLLILSQISVEWFVKFAALLFLFFYPSSFFLVAAYSEGMFLASSLGCVYFMSGSKKTAAAFWGFFAGVARLVGLLLIPAILLAEVESRFFDKTAPKSSWRGYLPSLETLPVLLYPAYGVLAFFLYCKIRFGVWDLYQQSQMINWGIRPTLMGLIGAKTWTLPSFNSMREVLAMPADLLSRSYAVVTAWTLLAGVLLHFWRRPRYGPSPIPSVFLFGAVAFFGLPVYAMYGLGLPGLIRYTFPVYVFFTISVLHHLSLEGKKGLSIAASILLIVACIPNSYYLVLNIMRFTRFVWVG